MKYLQPLRQHRISLVFFLLFCFLFGASNLQAATREETMEIIDTNNIQWKDYPGLPGVQFVVLAGDPSKPGIYTIRVKFEPHIMSRPHWHPEERYVTVLKGTWWAGTGPVFDRNTTTPVSVGGFADHTAKEIHYDGAKDEQVIVQITGMGPSGTIPVNPDGSNAK